MSHLRSHCSRAAARLRLVRQARRVWSPFSAIHPLPPSLPVLPQSHSPICRRPCPVVPVTPMQARRRWCARRGTCSSTCRRCPRTFRHTSPRPRAKEAGAPTACRSGAAGGWRGRACQGWGRAGRGWLEAGAFAAAVWQSKQLGHKSGSDWPAGRCIAFLPAAPCFRQPVLWRTPCSSPPGERRRPGSQLHARSTQSIQLMKPWH
jgi:hypothetical protein